MCGSTIAAVTTVAGAVVKASGAKKQADSQAKQYEREAAQYERQGTLELRRSNNEANQYERQGDLERQRADNEAATYDQQAKLYKQQADLERVSGNYDANRLTEEGKSAIGGQVAAYASSGVDVSSGTIAAAVRQTGEDAGLDVNARRFGARAEVGKQTTQAAFARSAAASSRSYGAQSKAAYYKTGQETREYGFESYANYQQTAADTREAAGDTRKAGKTAFASYLFSGATTALSNAYS